jgi:hypothetical protein
MVTVKPEGSKWYSQSGISGADQVLANIHAWDSAYSGFVSLGMTIVDVNTIHGTIVFDTQANGEQWLADLKSEPNHMTRDAYLATLPVTQTITGSVQ